MTEERQDNDETAADDELADIVAYLDGELEEPAIELMERRLVSEDPLRRYADSLDQTWHLLDSLEDVAASGEFTQKTLTSLDVIESESDAAVGERSSWATAIWQNDLISSLAGWAVFGFLLAAIGLQMGRLSAQSQQGGEATEILRQLPVLQEYHQYRVIPDLEFLNALSLEPAVTPPATNAP